ncbi:MAG: phage baseplate assembly protein V [Nakamurella sp.]
MTRPAVGSVAPIIKANGTELSAIVLNSLIDMRVSLALRLPGRARITFLDAGFAISAGGVFDLGTKISVETASSEKLFTGEVTGVELDVELGAPNMTVIADDESYKMTLGNKARTFADMGYSDVVSKIVREIGIPLNITATSSVPKYLLQADSDFGFVSEICDRVGYDWWVDPTGTMQVHPMGSQQGAAPKLDWRTGTVGLRHFSVRASALHPQKVTAHGWDAGTARSLTANSKPATNNPTASLVVPYINASRLTQHSAVTTGYRMFAAQGDGLDLASSTATLAATSAVTAEGLCNVNSAIQVGHQVAVAEVGPASGTYAVTEVEHTYTARGFLTRFTAGDRLPTGLVDTLSAPVVSSFRQDALVVGLVTNAGDNSAPKGYVKVKYPSLGDQVESAWARVVAMGAGASRGMTFLPEVNDEVIVGFEGGDVTRPLVLGGLYSTTNTALDYGVNEGKIARRQIVSRLGHVIELGDGITPADQRIALTLAGGQHTINLGKDGLVAKVPAGEPVSIAAGDTKIEFDKQGNITMSGQKITIKATQDVEISGLNVTVKANAKVEASGLEVKVTGSVQAEVASGGITSVKGSLVKIN